MIDVRIKFRNYLFVLLMSGSVILLSGCNSSKIQSNPVMNESENSGVYIENSDQNDVDVGNKEDDDVKVEGSSDVQTTTEIESSTSNSNSVVSDTQESVTLSDDEIVIKYYDDSKDEIDNYIRNSNYDSLKSKGKSLFITTIDFLFYGGDIKGVYLKDISSSTKKIVVDRFIESDEIISQYIPNYKETISSKYNSAMDVLKSGIDKLGDKITDFLGQDIVDEYGTLKDDFINTISDTGSKVKDKVNEWYQNFKK